MTLEMELDYRLRWLDFDRFGRIQPVAVLDLCQDIATLHAEHMGIGRDTMLEKGVFWAVIRTKYEIVRAPRYFQAVRVRTWPHSPSRFSFQRDFAITGEDGQLLVKATMEWVLMDMQTRKFAKITDHYAELGELSEERMFDSRLRKVASFDEGNRPVRTMQPGFSDIDLNGHVNNARYPRFAVDALCLEPDSAIRSFQIDYRREVLPDATLAMHTLVENGHALSKGVLEDGDIAFACAFELE